MYTCDICKKTFAQKSRYTAHTQRKRPCKAEEEEKEKKKKKKRL